ncbi:MAG: prohibitin family protein [Anaerolineales bacterium]|nr:prohibitin family protein [Anaerolineales bacterium]
MNIASAVRVLATLSWVATLGLVALGVVRSSRGKSFKSIGRIVIVVGILSLALTTVASGMVFIQPDERGVVISAISPQGYRSEPLEPGLRWVIPFAENVVTYSISRQTYTMSIAPTEGRVQGDDSVAGRTSDGQVVLIDASVIYAIDPSQIIDVHILWRNRYEDELVRPVARGIIRDQASQYQIDEINSEQRFEMVGQIREELAVKLQENGLILVDFVLRNVQFSDEYAASVEQKQIAEQLAQQAVFVVEQRRQEAEQARQVAAGSADAAVIAAQGRADARIIEAEAEATALELIAEALRSNPDLLTYEYILNLAPNIQVMLVPNDNPYLLPLPSLEGSGAVTP